MGGIKELQYRSKSIFDRRNRVGGKREAQRNQKKLGGASAQKARTPFQDTSRFANPQKSDGLGETGIGSLYERCKFGELATHGEGASVQS